MSPADTLLRVVQHEVTYITFQMVHEEKDRKVFSLSHLQASRVICTVRTPTVNLILNLQHTLNDDVITEQN